MADFTEIGATGLKSSGGLPDAEFLTWLKGSRGRAFYREMSLNSSTVGAILFGLRTILKGLDWEVQPAEDGDPEVAHFVEECRQDMSQSWDQTLADICSMFVYGWSWHEVVYKQRVGPDQADPVKRSRFTDGRIGWRKWAPRAQDTLQRFEFGDDGSLAGMVQQTTERGTVSLPIDKSLLFRLDAENGNPEGVSLLRTAAVDWFYLKRVREIEAIGIERDLAGLPVAYVPQEWLSETATAADQRAYQQVVDVVGRVKRNEQEGLVLPHLVTDGGTVKTVELQLMTSGGARQFDVGAVINRYNNGIATSVMMDFLLLGQSGFGTQALASTKTDLWLQSIEAVANAICDVVNSYAIPRLLQVNGITADPMPMLSCGQVQEDDLDKLSQTLERLLRAGAVTPDDALDEWTRQEFGLPAPDPTDEAADTPTMPAADAEGEPTELVE